jgi:hypothetical protein
MDKDGRTKIYTIFGGAFQKDAEKILKTLQTRCREVDFIGKDAKPQIETAIKKIKSIKKNLDGILLFGIYYNKDITSIGLPVIMVRGLLYWGENWDRGLLHYYKGTKLIDACLCKSDTSSSVSSSRFDDLVGKIELITALRKVKDSKLLNITYHADDPGSGPCFRDGGSKPADYKKLYFPRLKDSFGLGMKTTDYHELNKAIKKTEIKEAEKIADMWISEAKEVKDTSREEIIKSARMYLAIAGLMEKYNCNSMTMASWGFFMGWGELNGKGVTDAMPPLAEMEIAKQLKVTSCETLLDCIVTQMVGLYITGRPSFAGDALGFDPVNELAVFGHCYAPINPHGNDRVPYIIRSHATSNMLGRHTAVGIQVELPLNETITAAKISVYHKKISLFTGKTVSGRDFYNGFDDLMCRTKLTAKIDVKSVLKNMDNDTFGHHYVIFYGDWREKFNRVATLLGFELLEEDRY